MAACSLRVLPKQASQGNELTQDFYRYSARASVDYNEFLRKSDPRDAVAHTKIARALIRPGRRGRRAAALGRRHSRQTGL